MTQEAGRQVKSADRVIDLFELLARSGTGMTHTEIAASLDIPKSSLTPLLRNMLGRHYIASTPDGRRYQLGNALLALVKTATALRDIAADAEVFLRQATKEVGESSGFNQLRGDHQEVVATVLGSQRLVMRMQVGDVAPLHVTSSGKVILSHMPRAFQQAYLDSVKFQSWTPTTIVTREALEGQLEAIRETGFGYSFGEWTTGIVGIAAVVAGRDGLPLGAVNFAIPEARFTEDLKARAERALKRCATDIERQVSS